MNKEEKERLRAEIAECRRTIARLQRCMRRRPGSYLPSLGCARHRLGRLYLQRGDRAALGSAVRQLLRSLDAFERYRGVRDFAGERLAAAAELRQLAARTDDPARSETILRRLLELYRREAEKEWLVYSEDVACTQWMLGNLCFDAGRADEAERYYLDCLATHEAYDEEDPQRYRPATVQCLRNLGLLYERLFADPVRAEARWIEAERIGRGLCDDPVERCNRLPSLIRTCRLLADLYEETGRADEACRYRSQIEESTRELAELRA